MRLQIVIASLAVAGMVMMMSRDVQSVNNEAEQHLAQAQQEVDSLAEAIAQSRATLDADVAKFCLAPVQPTDSTQCEDLQRRIAELERQQALLLDRLATLEAARLAAAGTQAEGCCDSGQCAQCAARYRYPAVSSPTVVSGGSTGTSYGPAVVYSSPVVSYPAVQQSVYASSGASYSTSPQIVSYSEADYAVQSTQVGACADGQCSLGDASAAAGRGRGGLLGFGLLGRRR